MDKAKLQGDLVVVAMRSRKTGNDVRALGINLGYTVKLLTFKDQDIAECLGLSVMEYRKQFVVVEGERTLYNV